MLTKVKIPFYCLPHEKQRTKLTKGETKISLPSHHHTSVCIIKNTNFVANNVACAFSWILKTVCKGDVIKKQKEELNTGKMNMTQ